MILCVDAVMEAAALATARAALANAVFEDGKKTAGWAARQVKHNLQLSKSDKVHSDVSELALNAIARNEVVQAAALPRTYRPPLISRYETGMSYGRHVDDAIMGSPPVRADLSYTLFLSEPEDYQGGELILELTEGDHSYKLAAGSLLLYPSTTLHRVAEVTAGIRLVVVGWIQSLCADPRLREVLFDLYRARRILFERDGKSEVVDLLSKTQSNLLRSFANP
jgi:PKHD-type hydroxylase